MRRGAVVLPFRPSLSSFDCLLIIFSSTLIALSFLYVCLSSRWKLKVVAYVVVSFALSLLLLLFFNSSWLVYWPLWSQLCTRYLIVIFFLFYPHVNFLPVKFVKKLLFFFLEHLVGIISFVSLTILNFIIVFLLIGILCDWKVIVGSWSLWRELNAHSGLFSICAITLTAQIGS